MEGYLKKCIGYKCPTSCCSGGFSEHMDEFLLSPRKRLKHIFDANDIKTKVHPNEPNLIWYKGCSDNKSCKLLKLFPDQDIRPLVCKIFPYKRIEITSSWHNKKTIGIYLKNCPATYPNYSVPKEFTEEIIKLIKHHYISCFGENVDVKIIKK